MLNKFKQVKYFYYANRMLSMALAVLVFAALALAIFMFYYTATPSSITMSSGPVGSSFEKNAEKYKKILAREGIKLTILPSEGSVDNLSRLTQKKTKVDVGFVQSGDFPEGSPDFSMLVSLGSVNYQPLMIFYRGNPKSLLSDFKGERLDIGQVGSGAHAIALTLLKVNGIEPADGTTLIDRTTNNPISDLMDNKIDALFLMGDSTPSELIRQLLRTPGINLFNFTQADGYSRRINYLHKLEIPKGAIDFGKNIPEEDVSLIGPSVELVARKDFHPALSDALLEAAREVNGTPGLYRKRGEFPGIIEHDLVVSQDAIRYYNNGKSFLYRTFPFWLASLITRLLGVVVPLGLILIPGLKILPSIYRWHIHSRIYPWYKNLLDIERVAFGTIVTQKELDEQLAKLDQIEQSVNSINIPASYGDLFYGLKGNISFVRERILSRKTSN